jgi:hypothetical protein
MITVWVLIAIAAIADRLHKVNMQIVTLPVPAQEGITRDNVTVRVITAEGELRRGRRGRLGRRCRRLGDRRGRPLRVAHAVRPPRSRSPAPLRPRAMVAVTAVEPERQM